jgi:D-beta-D-heptose 7-phosphate kinase/D-beta-D-heptose 1-phosphate adenosyltransferase
MVKDINYIAKIKSLDELEQLVTKWRVSEPNACVGITSGVYDLVHPGHVSLLAAAGSQCDYLIVVIASDRTVREQKGEDKPYIVEIKRAQTIAGLGSVDAVIISDELYHETILKRTLPNKMFKGDEYKGCQIHGSELVGEMVFIPCSEKDFNSSSTIAKEIQRRSLPSKMEGNDFY